jgi:hypothetical protein
VADPWLRFPQSTLRLGLGTRLQGEGFASGGLAQFAAGRRAPAPSSRKVHATAVQLFGRDKTYRRRCRITEIKRLWWSAMALPVSAERSVGRWRR